MDPRSGALSLAIVASAVVAAPASAQQSYRIEIAAGPLGDAADALAQSTHSSIAIADPALAALPVRRLAGRFSTTDALHRMVRGLPVRIITVDAAAFRIVPTPPTARIPHPDALTRLPTTPPADIVVTATKRDGGLAHYPATAQVVDAEAFAFTERDGTGAIERVATSLSSTHLGSGRDKLFLRGVGDSSYSGQAQATVGQYFGEARLNYAGPDPDLKLYDIARVELLLGPQGALYGAGSLGGIIRIEPRAADASGTDGALTLSRSFTRHGAPGAEAAAMLNLPLSDGTAALRMVGYRTRDGGFIDDVGRGITNANRLDTIGARMSLTISPAAGWHIDLAGIAQHIDARDAGYADMQAAPLARAAIVGEPFAKRYRLASMTMRHDAGPLTIVANLSRSYARLQDRFDSGRPSPDILFFDRSNTATVTAGEARISHKNALGGGWLAGIASVESSAIFATLSHEPQSVFALATRAAVSERTLFGEGTQSVGPVDLALGLRLVRWHSRATAAGPLPDTSRRVNDGWRSLPSVAATVPVTGAAQLLLRYAESYRPDSASVATAGKGFVDGDRFAAWEAAIRVPPATDRVLTGSLGVSLGRWRDVQADTVDSAGFLLTTNIGDARLLTVEATAGWQASRRLRLSGGATFNRATIQSDDFGIIIIPKARLPNVPRLHAQMTVAWQASPAARVPYTLSSRLVYFGESNLGIGPSLTRPQGDYFDWEADASVILGRATLFARVTNLFDTAGNRFALGSIAQAATGTQFVPQVPRTATIGIRFETP
ncbi:outer membrane receptor protein involved in Fe transport [Sphingomonas zeicaulis]|uniref:TonB-dependent receptor n=1 Tax=Sphingomonas zeicaulis TaxID=1632740 RepID=UPI003D247947